MPSGLSNLHFGHFIFGTLSARFGIMENFHHFSGIPLFGNDAAELSRRIGRSPSWSEADGSIRMLSGSIPFL